VRGTDRFANRAEGVPAKMAGNAESGHYYPSQYRWSGVKECPLVQLVLVDQNGG